MMVPFSAYKNVKSFHTGKVAKFTFLFMAYPGGAHI